MLLCHSLDSIQFNTDSIVINAHNEISGDDIWKFKYSDILYIHSTKTELTIEFKGTLMDHRFTRIIPNFKK